MPRGAIHTNEAARDYRFRVRSEATGSTNRDRPYNARATGTLTWGNAYAGGSHGIELKIRQDRYAGGVTDYTVTLTTPWGTFSYNAGGWPVSIESILEFDNLKLVVTSSCGWTLSFDECRWYVDGVLRQTIGAQSQSGTGFDLRLDIFKIAAFAQLTGEFALIPCSDGLGLSCAPDFASEEASYLDNVEITAIGGWQFDVSGVWTEDSVRIKSVTLPGSTCLCPTGQPGIFEEESWDLEAAAKNFEQLVVAYRGVCTPSGGPGPTPINQDEWRKDLDYIESRSHVVGIPDSSGIENHTTFASVVCDADSDSSSGTTPEPWTYCEHEQVYTIVDQFRHCHANTDDPATLPGCTYTESACCTTTTQRVTWPDLPWCAFPYILAYAVAPDQRHARVVGDGTVLSTQISGNVNPLAWGTAKNAGFNADSAWLEWARIGNKAALILWTEESGAIKQRRSYNEGDSWEVATTIEAGPGKKKPAACIGRENLRFIYWIDGTAVKGQIRGNDDAVVEATFTAYAGPVDDQPMVARERVLAGGKRQLVLEVIISGAVTELYSTSGLTFA
jgi:hypothetical protein